MGHPRVCLGHPPNSFPELIALPIIDGSRNYLNWMSELLASQV